MPKIFLIKDRLLQQQLKLLDQQKHHNEGLTPPGSPLSDSQPLSLIVNKRPSVYKEVEARPTVTFEQGTFYKSRVQARAGLRVLSTLAWVA
ncbi:hypothetical protein J6590_034552 [Homalodisca vitripennis]|nr:hypothetical protein J6590_034552 [Homalodisca vitripennis]